MPKRSRSDSQIDSSDAEVKNTQLAKRPRTQSHDTDKPELLDIQLNQKEFDAKDQEDLCKNEHERFMRTSDKVGHALLYKTTEGTFASQFNPPSTDVLEGVEIRSIHNIQILADKFGQYSKEYLRGTTPDGTEMVAKRKLHIETTDLQNGTRDYDMWRFSPTKAHTWNNKLFIGSGPEELPLFTDKLPPEVLKDLKKEQAELGNPAKHHVWGVDSNSVLERERRANVPRKPTQNVVMGGTDCSAFKELEAFREENEKELHPERLVILEKNKKAADIRKSKIHEKQYRGEWLHARGHGLTPWGQDPQTKDNLAAGPMWLNTDMMANGERTAKWFAMHRLDAKIQGDVRFNLIPGTEIIDNGHMKFSFTEDERKVVLDHPLNPWKKYVTFPKATDVCQTTMVTYNLITGSEPASTQKVSNLQGVDTMPKPYSDTHKSTSTTTITSSIPSALPQQVQSTYKQYRRSLVHITTEGLSYDYASPWKVCSSGKWHGSGMVININGKNYILTNAHVVENHKDIRVRLSTSNGKFKANAINIGHQCDLALLEITDPAFYKDAIPIELGSMVKLEDFVEVAGYPIGGTELCFTTGTVSRIQLGEYAHSGEHNLIVQTQAPMNAGNSGGPVIHDGKLVGVAFQVAHFADGLNYFIPIPVIKHFIKDSLSPEGYKGFPDLQIDLQELEGEELRKYYGLKSGQTGIRVQDIDRLSSVYKKLEKNDIITAIDGFVVSDEGRVNIPGIVDRIDLNYLFARKFIGDDVKMSIIRKNKKTGVNESKEVDVQLIARAGATKKIGFAEYDKFPSYFFHSGIGFQPLTPNLVEQKEGREFITMHSLSDKFLNDIPCRKLGDQLILISTVLKSDSTLGSEDIADKFIKKVNNRNVNNIKELLQALSKPIDNQTVIELTNGTMMVVKYLDYEANLELLKDRGIFQPCSNDLLLEYQESFILKTRNDVAVAAGTAIIETTPTYARKLKMLSDSDSDSDSDKSSDATKTDEEEDASVACDSDKDVDSDSDEEEEVRRVEMADFIDEEENEAVDPEQFIRQLNEIKDSGDIPQSSRGLQAFGNVVNKIQQSATGDAMFKMQQMHNRKRRLVVEDSDEEEERLEEFIKSNHNVLPKSGINFPTPPPRKKHCLS